MTKNEKRLEEVKKKIAQLECLLTGTIEADESIFKELFPLYKESNELSAKILEEILK